MWSFLTNPIVTHLIAAGCGAAGAWYAAHKTAVASAVSTVTALGATIKTDIAAVKKEI